MSTEKKCDIAIVGAAIADLQVYPVTKEITNTASYSAQSMEMKVGGDAISVLITIPFLAAALSPDFVYHIFVLV